MAERLNVWEINKTGNAGAWVSAPEYGGELPESDQTKFLVTRTANGLWTAAIRGYREGEALHAEVASASKSLLGVEVDGTVYHAFGHTDAMMPVTDEQRGFYDAIVKSPEVQRDLLAQVLEQEDAGVWAILGPAEYNLYDSYAELSISDADHVGLRWGSFTGGADTGSSSEGGFSGYMLGDAIAARTQHNGPLHRVAPLDSSAHGLFANSLVDRIKQFPTRASLTRELTEDDAIKLQYLGDAFEFGGQTSAALEEPALSVIHRHSS